MHLADWSQVVPMDYLNPFLDVILSPETSGPVTSVALVSVLRMLDHYVLGMALLLGGVVCFVHAPLRVRRRHAAPGHIFAGLHVCTAVCYCRTWTPGI